MTHQKRTLPCASSGDGELHLISGGCSVVISLHISGYDGRMDGTGAVVSTTGDKAGDNQGYCRDPQNNYGLELHDLDCLRTRTGLPAGQPRFG